MKLTAAKVKSIKESGRYGDGNGLQLLVTKALNKSWVYRFQLNNRRRDMGLGKYPTISLSDARNLRDEAAKKVSMGIDPLTERNKLKREMSNVVTFKQLALEYISNNSRVWSNAKHAQQWANTLRTYAFPVIGDVPVKNVNTAMIQEILNPIWLTKSETATRVMSRIENIIDYAIALDHSDKANPAALKVIKAVMPQIPKSTRIKHFSAMPYVDVPSFYAQIADKKSISAQALKLTILTATRTSEVLGAKWDEFSGDVWEIPSIRMKSKREHRVPLCSGLIDVVESMPRMNEYLFPSVVSNGKHLSNMAMLKFLKSEMNQPYTVHGFRSSFRDWVGETTEFDIRLAETSLAHVLSDKTEAAYARGDLLEKRRLLMSEWFNYVTSETEFKK